MFLYSPITLGDTAFRSLRMIISETFGINQTKMTKRIILAIPIFIISFY